MGGVISAGSASEWHVWQSAFHRKPWPAKMQTKGVNIAQDAISNIESGARLVMDYELRAFASVLQIPIEDLLDLEEE